MRLWLRQAVATQRVHAVRCRLEASAKARRVVDTATRPRAARPSVVTAHLCRPDHSARRDARQPATVRPDRCRRAPCPPPRSPASLGEPVEASPGNRSAARECRMTRVQGRRKAALGRNEINVALEPAIERVTGLVFCCEDRRRVCESIPRAGAPLRCLVRTARQAPFQTQLDRSSGDLVSTARSKGKVQDGQRDGVALTNHRRITGDLCSIPAGRRTRTTIFSITTSVGQNTPLQQPFGCDRLLKSREAACFCTKHAFEPTAR